MLFEWILDGKVDGVDVVDLIAKTIGYIVILLFIFCMLSFFYTEFRNRLTYEIAKRKVNKESLTKDK